MTVCIAARCVDYRGPFIVCCTDLMGSNDLSGAETAFKFQMLGANFVSLLAGPMGTARELAGNCGAELQAGEIGCSADVMSRLRIGIGQYKHDFAESHIQSKLGISYAEFRSTGKASLPVDLYRDLSWEIRNHSSGVELIVIGFINVKAAIFKVSGDVAWPCDDFAVIGTGTGLGEASLFYREHHMLCSLETTLYHVYEAKRMAEKAPYVGKATMLFLLRPGGKLEMVADRYTKQLDGCLSKFSPSAISGLPDLQDGDIRVL